MSKALSRLLLIESHPVCGALLPPGDFEVEQADRLSVGLEKIDRQSFDLILLDLSLPDSQGLNAFGQTRAAAPRTPIVVVADLADEEPAARTLQMGAQDYLLRQHLTGLLLTTTMHKAIDRHRGQLAHGYEGFLLQTLMDKIPDAVYFKDRRSRFLMISRAHAKKFGLTDPAQAAGKTDADFFSRPHAQQALTDEETILRSGDPMVDIEESETWPDGSVTWASTTKMPLRNQAGRIVGTFGISRDITKRKRAEEALAERTQQLQKKNQQIEDEMKMARELQLAMLPQKFPAVPPHRPAHESALKFFSFFLPSGAVSGDFFDVVALSDTSVGVFICDVMGHDVRAALVTAMIRALVEDLSGGAADPGQLLAQINRGLLSVFQQAGTTMFATAFYMVADVATGEICYASAAHPDPLQLLRHEGKVEPMAALDGGKKGPALGLFKEAQFPTYRRRMNAGDVILLYTDGMIEVEGRDQEMFSQESLTAIVKKHAGLPTKEMLSALLAEIRQFSGQHEFTDDVCLVGVEVKQLGSDPPAQTRQP
ncbi:MAG: SpoIIE family protein phosphatase [Verrucomicrobiia bacterium]